MEQEAKEMYDEFDQRSWVDKFDVLESVKLNGLELVKASDVLKSDKEVVLEAVKQEPLSIMFASDDLKNDLEIALLAVQSNFFAYKHIGKIAQENDDIVNIVYPQYKDMFDLPFEEKADWYTTLKSFLLNEMILNESDLEDQS